MWNMNMYDEYSTNPATDAQPIIVPYHITLLGRHRHLAVQFLFNTLTQRCTSTKKDDSQTLSGILRHRFGSDAIGVLVGGKAEYYEDEMIRSGVVPLTGGQFHVLYDDSAPPYEPATASSSSTGDTQLPTFHETTRPRDRGREQRALGMTFYESVPTITHQLSIRTGDGTVHTLRLDNKSLDRTDPVAQFLATKGGDRAVALRVPDTTDEFTDDNVLYSPATTRSLTWHVTYRPPNGLNVLQKSIDKRRNVQYTALPDPVS